MKELRSCFSKGQAGIQVIFFSSSPASKPNRYFYFFYDHISLTKFALRVKQFIKRAHFEKTLNKKNYTRNSYQWVSYAILSQFPRHWPGLKPFFLSLIAVSTQHKRGHFMLLSYCFCKKEKKGKISAKLCPGVPNDGFLLNALKRLFRLSRVLLDL